MCFSRLVRRPNQHPRHCQPLVWLRTSSECSVVLPHIRWRLDGWNVFQDGVTDANEANNGTWDDTEPLLADDDGTDEDIDYDELAGEIYIAHSELTDAATEEREHEGSITGDLLWDLKL